MLLKKIQINTVFIPDELKTLVISPDAVFIVIDVIRATTSITTILDHEAKTIAIAGSTNQAQNLFKTGSYDWIAGEIGGQRPEGFTFGNSPAEFLHSNVTGTNGILSTTNGTRAILACPENAMILAGCYRNAPALCEYALHQSLTRKELPEVVLVCSGREQRVAIDDTACAGYLIRTLLDLAEQQELSSSLNEGSQIALQINQQTSSIKHVLAQSDAGQAVIRIGLEEDISVCAAINTSRSVPMVIGRNSDGLPIISNAAYQT